MGPGVRVDDGFEEGSEIPVYYDSLLSKLVVHGASRNEAIRRMIRAISEYHVTGIKTTLGFGKWVMQHPQFVKGEFDTGFISKHFDPENFQSSSQEEKEVAAILAASLVYSRESTASATGTGKARQEMKSNWRTNRLRE